MLLSTKLRRALTLLLSVRALACSVEKSNRSPALPEPCTLKRAYRELEPDLRTVDDLCPGRRRISAAPVETDNTAEEDALAQALLEQLCEVDAEEPLTCVASRAPAYADLVENSAYSVFLGSFTRTGARQAALAVGPVSVLFEWKSGKFEPRTVLPDLELEFGRCLVVAPPKHASQIACFQETRPRSQTILDVHDFASMRTTRLFSFRDTYLEACGDVDAQQLLDLVPGVVSAARRQLAPSVLALSASYLSAHTPAEYNRSCTDLLHRNFEMGPMVGATAALACALPQYTEVTLEYTFADDNWQPSTPTQALLDSLYYVDGRWYRTITSQPIALEKPYVQH